jgi:hypothetical protein
MAESDISVDLPKSFGRRDKTCLCAAGFLQSGAMWLSDTEIGFIDIRDETL